MRPKRLNVPTALALKQLVTGYQPFITSRLEETFNGDDVGGIGTGTYTEMARSNYDPVTDPPLYTDQLFNYIVDITDPVNPGTFLIEDPSGDHIYGVMSPDTSVLGVVNVDPDGLADLTDTTVFLGVAVIK